jgi:hypothetical protein
MRTLVSLLVIAAAAGCGTDATVSGVFPAEGFSGRTLRVEISGDATEWSGSPGVNFGQGVTVSNVTVASPTSLFADITIADDATPGTRDVTITNDGTFTLKSSFMIESPMELVFDGMVAQGGTPYFTVTNHDFDTPFDVSSADTDTGFNFEITAPAGANFFVQDATPYQIKGFVFIDTDAMPGPFSISSGTTGHEVAFNLGANVDVTPRAPTPFTDMTTGMLAATGDSALYSISVANGPSLMRLAATSSDADAAPSTAILPDGTWATAGSGSLFVQPTSGTVDVVVFDGGTAGGYNFTLKSKVEQLTAAAEAAGTNDTTATALNAAALPFMQTGGTLSAAADADYIKIVLASPAVVHLNAFAADDQTDTAVDILASGSGNPTVLTNYQRTQGDPVDEGVCFQLFGIPCGEDITSPMLAAGTYYIVIKAGGEYANVGGTKYTALIYLN